MFGRKNSRHTVVETLVGANSKINGDVHFNGGCHIDGTVRGNVTADPDTDSALSISDVGNVDGGFSRTDVRAVDVKLATDEQGRLAVADVPVMTSVEPAGTAPGWPVGQAPPSDVSADALALLAGFGSDAELQSAGETAAGWRLVFSIGDASGLRFPIAVHIAP